MKVGAAISGRRSRRQELRPRPDHDHDSRIEILVNGNPMDLLPAADGNQG